jgi:CPA1 family monovalent cation:H+ antiporter
MSADRIELLVIVVAAVAILARKLRLPYTVGLVFAGVGLGLLPGNEHLRLTRELVFSFLLPPLVFEAAVNLKWPALRRDLALVSTFATFGLVIAAAIVAVGMHLLVAWPITTSVVFAVLISATDPVSVISAFKESGKSGRIRLIVEAESLLNDGTAAAAFVIAIAFATGEHVGVWDGVVKFSLSAGGGILAGAIVALVGLIIIGKTDDHLVEIVITLGVAYGAFFLAEELQLSGVLATVTAGLLVVNYGSVGSFSDKGREAVESFWEFAAFAANSVVFLLIGVRATRMGVGLYVVPTLLAIALVLVGRAVSVYGLSALFSRSRWRVNGPGQHLLFWGGLRGALALALVLGAPDTVPGVPELTVVTFGVVIFSVVVQGLTINPLIARATREA